MSTVFVNCFSWASWLIVGASLACLLIATGVGVMAFRHFFPSGAGSHTEDLTRLRKLATAITALKWSEADTVDDLQRLVDGLVELFQAEIDYYYNARASSRRASGQFRLIAFVLGTLGLLCPLVQPMLPASYGWVSKLGYVFLAGAAASLAGNELFGGTRSHVRYVITQYELEALITQFLLDWSVWKASAPRISDAQLNPSEPIKRMKIFAEACHKAVADETQAWGLAVMQAAANYGKDVQHAQSRKG